MNEDITPARLEHRLAPEDLRAQVDALPRKQRELGEVFLERPEVFAFGTLEALEKLLDVSRITIIRFAKNLGYSGYSTLQEAVRDDYLSQLGFDAPRSEAANLFAGRDLQKRVAQQQQSDLDSALANLDMVQVEEICKLLLVAPRILVCGTGSSSVVAALFVRLLRHVGLRGELVNPNGVDRVIATNDLTEADVVVGVSLWLTFNETLQTMELARRSGAHTVAIIGSQASPLKRFADRYLFAPAQGIVPKFSVVAAVAIVEILIAELATSNPGATTNIQDRLYDLYVEQDLIAPTRGLAK